MIPVRSRWCSFLTVVVLFTVPSPAAPDESQPPATAESAGAAETVDLLTRVRDTDDALYELSQKIPTANGEDLEILRARRAELVSQQIGDLSSLLQEVDRRRRSQLAPDSLQAQVEALVGRSSRHLRRHIDLLSGDLRERSLQRKTVPVEELGDFEHQMAVDTARLDALYQALIRLVSAAKAAGLAVDDEREFLSSHLTDRGEHLLEVFTLAGAELEETQALLKRTPENQELQGQSFSREERYDSNKAALLSTIHMLRELDLDYAALEVRVLELTGEVTPDALELDVAEGFLSRELNRLASYLVDSAPRFIVRALVILLLLLGFWLLAHVTRVLVGKAMQHRALKPSQLLRDIVVAMSGRIVLFIGLILILSQLGIDLGPLFAGLGIVGLVVGFALQDSLSNFASGAMILAYRPFDVGDLVEAAGVVGKVTDMNLVSTRILTPDNQRLVLPNSKIWGEVIRNMTSEAKRRVDLTFGISYEDEIPKAERLLSEIVSGHDKVLADPAPVIKLHALNDSSVDFVVRPWALTDDYWDVYWDITREVKMRFDAEGISIPYPQTDVHLIADTESPPDA